MVIAGIPCTMPAIWIGLIVIFLIVEGLTAGLVTICLLYTSDAADE